MVLRLERPHALVFTLPNLNHRCALLDYEEEERARHPALEHRLRLFILHRQEGVRQLFAVVVRQPKDQRHPLKEHRVLLTSHNDDLLRLHLKVVARESPHSAVGLGQDGRLKLLVVQQSSLPERVARAEPIHQRMYAVLMLNQQSRGPARVVMPRQHLTLPFFNTEELCTHAPLHRHRLARLEHFLLHPAEDVRAVRLIHHRVHRNFAERCVHRRPHVLRQPYVRRLPSVPVQILG
mmetsp:Transcript_7352/g.24396  ORF Transcript_7352/g.24396 Transcript_7352/m.24396 type:complete len:236 (-) Transcript_7352:813-1520(-)